MSTKKINAKSFLAGGMLTLLAVGALTTSVYAFNGSGNSNRGAGIETSTYEEWKERVEERENGNTNILDIVTADNFDQFKEMLTLQRDGDTEGADKIRAELGLPTSEEMEAHREEVEAALESKDYNAWKEAISDSPRGEDLLEKIDSEEDFNKFSEAHEYREKSREIMEELGFERPEKGQGMKGGQGMGGGQAPRR